MEQLPRRIPQDQAPQRPITWNLDAERARRAFNRQAATLIVGKLGAGRRGAEPPQADDDQGTAA